MTSLYLTRIKHFLTDKLQIHSISWCSKCINNTHLNYNKLFVLVLRTVQARTISIYIHIIIFSHKRRTWGFELNIFVCTRNSIHLYCECVHITYSNNIVTVVRFSEISCCTAPFTLCLIKYRTHTVLCQQT